MFQMYRDRNLQFEWRLHFILALIAGLVATSANVSPPKRTSVAAYGTGVKGLLHNVGSRASQDSGGDTWWQSISRNNTLACKCGTFGETSDAADLEPWGEEQVSKLNVYPWSVSLVAPGGSYAFCGGSLVNDRFVLTSAACVDGSNSEGVEVLVGTWPQAHFNKPDEEPDELKTNKVIRKKVIRVILHPKYLDGHLDYNIALLRLNGPVPTFGNKEGVVPVCLPEPEESFDGFNSSSLLWRFHQGDGIIIPVRRTEVTWRVLEKSTCKDIEYSEQWENMPDTLLCAETEEPPSDHVFHDTFDCPGDAGGPLVVTRGGEGLPIQKVQIGVDSWTACYGRPKGVGIFTRVQEFLPWIKLHISKDGRHCTN